MYTILGDHKQVQPSTYQKISRVFTNTALTVSKSFWQLIGYTVIDLYDDESDYLGLDRSIVICKTKELRRKMIWDVLSSYFPGDLKVLKFGKLRCRVRPFRWRIDFIANFVWKNEIALAMTMHPRLGAASRLRLLPDEIFERIRRMSLA